MDFRRAKFLLPNLFTLTSIGAGLYSIHLSTQAQSVSQMMLAAWVLVVSMVCDAFDGRVARMTRTESELGIQLDSLADSISFGVAPAFLLFHWGLESWGVAGMAVAFVYVACAVLRLARFNVLSARGEGVESKKYFVGLPTPLAAGAVVAVVLAHLSYAEVATSGAAQMVAVVTVVLAVLMVSNVRYRTFKDVNLEGGAVAVAGLVVATSVGASIVFKPYVTFVLLMVAYIGLGIVGGILELGKTLVGDEESEESYLAEASDGQ